MSRPTRETLTEYFDYDPGDGVLRWKVKRRNVSPGDIAGTVSKTLQGHSYRRVNLFRVRYPVSHVAWVLMTGDWPPAEVDHRNGDTLDNRWTNLRLASKSQNQWNAGPMRNNTSGYKGVFLDKRSGRWVAQINHQTIGHFATAEEAASAYDKEAIARHGEFARLNLPKGDEPCC